jgi:spore germination protein (amino acid permease)
MKVQITNGMFMALIINMVYAKGIGMTQGSMAREVNGDIWISTIFATVFGAILMLMVVLIIKRLPDSDLIAQTQWLFGKIISKIIAFSFFIFFLGAYGTIMATYVYHLKDYFLPEAPYFIFILLALLIGSFATYYGIEVIARMALIGVFSIIALNILILLGSLSEFDIRELQPTFQSGFIDTFWASRHFNTDLTIAVMMTCMILPLVNDKKAWSKSSVTGIFYCGAFILLWSILEAGVLSPEVCGQYVISCMQLARSAQMGIFIHRYEMIMIALFSFSLLTQIKMTLLCSAVSVQKVLGLKDYRPVIIPVALLLNGFGYWLVVDHNRAMEFVENSWVIVSLSIGVGLPCILFILGLFFKKKLKIGRERSEVRQAK